MEDKMTTCLRKIVIILIHKNFTKMMMLAPLTNILPKEHIRDRKNEDIMTLLSYLILQKIRATTDLKLSFLKKPVVLKDQVVSVYSLLILVSTITKLPKISRGIILVISTRKELTLCMQFNKRLKEQGRQSKNKMLMARNKKVGKRYKI